MAHAMALETTEWVAEHIKDIARDFDQVQKAEQAPTAVTTETLAFESRDSFEEASIIEDNEQASATSIAAEINDKKDETVNDRSELKDSQEREKENEDNDPTADFIFQDERDDSSNSDDSEIIDQKEKGLFQRFQDFLDSDNFKSALEITNGPEAQMLNEEKHAVAEDILDEYFSGRSRDELNDSERLEFDSMANCFDPETLVVTPDGVGRIGRVLPGSYVVACDGNMSCVNERVLAVRHYYDREVVTFTTEAGSFRVTPEHRIYRANVGDEAWITAENFVEGDLVRAPNGRLGRFISIEYRDELTDVVDIQVENNENFFVFDPSVCDRMSLDGMLVHNCQLIGRQADKYQPFADGIQLGLDVYVDPAELASKIVDQLVEEGQVRDLLQTGIKLVDGAYTVVVYTTGGVALVKGVVAGSKVAISVAKDCPTKIAALRDAIAKKARDSSLRVSEAITSTEKALDSAKKFGFKNSDQVKNVAELSGKAKIDNLDTFLSTAAKHSDGSALIFKSDKAVEHFAKHGSEVKNALGKSSYNLKEYMLDAHHVVKNGQYVPEMNGYVRLIGGQGSAKAAFVGMTKDGKNLTTMHVKTVSELKKKAPSLGWE